ncbi:MAG: hypothetical protein ACLPKE_30710 [Streptosporangiaceae bacterium]
MTFLLLLGRAGSELPVGHVQAEPGHGHGASGYRLVSCSAVITAAPPGVIGGLALPPWSRSARAVAPG